MRCLILTVVFLSLLFMNILNAHTINNSAYYERLYYTAKIWGFVKYFHTEVAKGIKDWDQVLLDALLKINENLRSGHWKITKDTRFSGMDFSNGSQTS